MLVLTISILILLGCPDRQTKNDLPNIIIIFTDDQGYGDLGCYGAEDFETPHIDRLAREGIKFTDFYAAQAVCSASRAGLLTGCYPNRIGISGALMPWAKKGLNPEEITIAELLKEKGYTTGIFGKWHLGNQPPLFPLQHGFDEYFGLPYSNDMWPVDFDGTPATKESKKPWKVNYPLLSYIDGNDKTGEIINLEDQSGITTRLTEKAIAFIEKNKHNPFFLYFPHSMPHVPLGVSENFRGKSKQGMYGDVIMEIDWSVGQIIKKLDALDLEDNTLIIFTSDNGPWLNFGNHAGSTGGFREGKGTTWEGGHRVPCVMKWPGVIPASVTIENLASAIDIFPTIAEIINSDLPEHKIDGVSILPLLKGDIVADPRKDFLFYYANNQLRAVRKNNWKLVFPHTYNSYVGVEPGNDGFEGPYARGEASLELYNLETDPFETMNLCDEYPDIVADLKVLADNSRDDLGDALRGMAGKNVRDPGYLFEVEKTIDHRAVGATVSLVNLYDRKYTGGGDSALTDGIIGLPAIGDRAWQAYREVDMVAEIDLGSKDTIREIQLGILKDELAWVFAPDQVKIEVSDDGKCWTQVAVIPKENYISLNKHGSIRAVGSLPPLVIQFIRITATNIGVCPEGHLAEGERAWLFVDEIIVK